jgi:DNA polymerase-3 subunit alpha
MMLNWACKFDFFGSTHLVSICCQANQQRPDGKGKNLDIDLIPYSLDEKNPVRRERVKKTFDLLSSGKTGNVFQIESDGMKKLFVGLKPDCLEDITAAVALYRPGPLGAGILSSFVSRKHGRETITYDHPCLEEILKPTYGIIVYQEQVMAIAVKLAGYTLASADLLRRAMGKKKPEEMKKQKEIFINGATSLGIDFAYLICI